jgi:hypothetical protein
MLYQQGQTCTSVPMEVGDHVVHPVLGQQPFFSKTFLTHSKQRKLNAALKSLSASISYQTDSKGNPTVIPCSQLLWAEGVGEHLTVPSNLNSCQNFKI